MLTQRPPRTEDPIDGIAVVEPESPQGALPHRSLRERIDVRVAIGVGVAWFVLTGIAAALEPAAQGSEPAIGAVLSAGVDVLLLAMLFGLAFRRRWGLVASLGAAAVVTAMAVACPTSGHHQYGLWWYGQMACVLTLVAVSVAALRLREPVNR
jgi:hypothetical protein